MWVGWSTVALYMSLVTQVLRMSNQTLVHKVAPAPGSISEVAGISKQAFHILLFIEKISAIGP